MNPPKFVLSAIIWGGLSRINWGLCQLGSWCQECLISSSAGRLRRMEASGVRGWGETGTCVCTEGACKGQRGWERLATEWNLPSWLSWNRRRMWPQRGSSERSPNLVEPAFRHFSEVVMFSAAGGSTDTWEMMSTESVWPQPHPFAGPHASCRDARTRSSSLQAGSYAPFTQRTSLSLFLIQRGEGHGTRLLQSSNREKPKTSIGSRSLQLERI